MTALRDSEQSTGSTAIGVDVGGTKIAAGVVTSEGRIVERVSPLRTPSSSQDALIEALYRLIGELRNRHPETRAIGVGAAGLVDWPEGFIRWAPNNSYRALALRTILENATGLHTVVDNDANVAAWGEACLDSSASYMAILTIGTGIGGGIVLDGQLYRGKTGLGAEVGHLIVDPYSNYHCSCGNVGCLEALASGTALQRYGQDAAADEPDGMIASLAPSPEDVTGWTVHKAARAGDATARLLFRRMGQWLGVGIASLVNVFDLERIVIGGGLVDAADLFLDSARASVEQYAFARQHRKLPPISLARLGTDAGWMGAGLLALGRKIPRD
jgi:Transcriptional regulator/sugar kinase